MPAEEENKAVIRRLVEEVYKGNNLNVLILLDFDVGRDFDQPAVGFTKPRLCNL